MLKSFNPSSARLNGPDHLRATAISLVFLYHYRLFAHPEWVNHVGLFGWTGVDLFFVLSGYLIGNQLLKQGSSISLKEFYLKRVFRILPLYFLMLILYFSVPGFREFDTISPLWKYLSFTQNFGLNVQQYHSFSHAWSLCVEEQFYLLFPLILLALIHSGLMKKAGWIIAGIFAAEIILRMCIWHFYLEPLKDSDDFWKYWSQTIYYPTYSRLDGLCAGLLIAGLKQFRVNIFLKLCGWGNWLLLISATILFMGWLITENAQGFAASVFGFSLVAIAFGFLMIAALSPKSILYKLRSGLSSAIALLSYSLYLSHKAVIHLTQELFGKWGINKEGNLMALVCVVTCVLAAVLLHVTVEKPFMKWRDQILARTKLGTKKPLVEAA